MSLFLPCLLQRWGAGVDGQGSRIANASWTDVRDDVVRNLQWLLNTEAPHHLRGVALPNEVRSSAFCFGVPAYSGRPQSTMSPLAMAKEIKQRVEWFEPRLQNVAVKASAEIAAHHFNTLRFVVSGELRSTPLRAFEVTTEIDMDTGEARLVNITV